MDRTLNDICRSCDHFCNNNDEKLTQGCRAFPDGILNKYNIGEEGTHDEVIKGQKGDFVYTLTNRTHDRFGDRIVKSIESGGKVVYVGDTKPEKAKDMEEQKEGTITKEDLLAAKRIATEDGYFGEVTKDNAFITDPDILKEVARIRMEWDAEGDENKEVDVSETEKEEESEKSLKMTDEQKLKYAERIAAEDGYFGDIDVDKKGKTDE